MSDESIQGPSPKAGREPLLEGPLLKGQLLEGLRHRLRAAGLSADASRDDPRWAGDETSGEGVTSAAATDSATDLDGNRWASPAAVISTGCRALDQWFPAGGMAAGNTIEIVSPALGSGGTHLALILARQVCGPQGFLVVIDRQHDFYPAPLVALGFDLRHVLIVRPIDDNDHLWALEQALGDPGVAAVWTRIDKRDKRYQRRWQLAAERGRTVGLLERPERVLGHPTWATVQIRLQSGPWSAWLAGNRQSSRGGNAAVDPENWVLELTGHRCQGRFDRPKLRLELHNRSWQQQREAAALEMGLETVSAAESSGAGAGEKAVVVRKAATEAGFPAAQIDGSFFLSQRHPHPNDPWFSKPVSADEPTAAADRPDSESAADESSATDRSAG